MVDPTDLWEIYEDKISTLRAITTVDPIDMMQTAAKEQITIITTLLTGGYFALTSIGDINTVIISLVSLPHGLGKALIIAPMVCWLLSLALANILYLSTLHRMIAIVSQSTEVDYTKIMRRYLFYSHWFMFLGFIFLFVILLLYIWTTTPISTPTPLQVQIIPLNS